MSQPTVPNFVPAPDQPNLIQGDLEVTGDALVDNNLTVKGRINAGSIVAGSITYSTIDVIGNATVGGTLGVTGQINGSDEFLSGGLTVTGVFTAESGATLGSGVGAGQSVVDVGLMVNGPLTCDSLVVEGATVCETTLVANTLTGSALKAYYTANNTSWHIVTTYNGIVPNDSNQTLLIPQALVTSTSIFMVELGAAGTLATLTAGGMFLNTSALTLNCTIIGGATACSTSNGTSSTGAFTCSTVFFVSGTTAGDAIVLNIVPNGSWASGANMTGAYCNITSLYPAAT